VLNHECAKLLQLRQINDMQSASGRVHRSRLGGNGTNFERHVENLFNLETAGNGGQISVDETER